jgi:hypothetical protein
MRDYKNSVKGFLKMTLGFLALIGLALLVMILINFFQDKEIKMLEEGQDGEASSYELG